MSITATRKTEKLIDEIMVIEKQRKKNINVYSQIKIKIKIKNIWWLFSEMYQKLGVPKDTPAYLNKALERAMKEYQVWIKHEKSPLDNFAEKYVIEGETKIIPIYYFEEKTHRITQSQEGKITVIKQDNAFFHSSELY